MQTGQDKEILEREKNMIIKRKKIQNGIARKSLPVYDTKEFFEAHRREVFKRKKQLEKYNKDKKVEEKATEIQDNIIDNITESNNTEICKQDNFLKKLWENVKKLYRSATICKQNKQLKI